MPFFICPNCKQRSVDHDGLQELDDVPVACERCGFGFLFELMEDYYPAPNSGFVVCDAEGRILATGRGVFELTGFQEQELLSNGGALEILSIAERDTILRDWNDTARTIPGATLPELFAAQAAGREREEEVLARTESR